MRTKGRAPRPPCRPPRHSPQRPASAQRASDSESLRPRPAAVLARQGRADPWYLTLWPAAPARAAGGLGPAPALLLRPACAAGPGSESLVARSRSPPWPAGHRGPRGPPKRRRRRRRAWRLGAAGRRSGPGGCGGPGARAGGSARGCDSDGRPVRPTPIGARLIGSPQTLPSQSQYLRPTNMTGWQGGVGTASTI